MSKEEEIQPYARLWCPAHGAVLIDEQEYTRQLDRPDQRWKCGCGRDAQWDDEYYEELHDDTDMSEDEYIEIIKDLRIRIKQLEEELRDT